MSRLRLIVISRRQCYAFLGSAVLLVILGFNTTTSAQTDDAFGDAAADPVKLFDRGQDAHARGELLKAIEFYEEAIKVRPEFPEAEFQRANVLVSLGSFAEAESGFRRAIELRKDWSLAYASLGSLLVVLKRDAEAEASLRTALKLDRESNLALRLLADLRLRAGHPREALDLLRRAINDKDTPGATWLLMALAERASGDNVRALASLDHVLQEEPRNVSALLERAELRIATGDKERGLQDLATAEPLIKADKAQVSRLASAYQSAGKLEEAHRVADAAGLIRAAQNSPNGTIKVIGSAEEIAAANSEDPAVSRKSLEGLLQKNPDNAMLLARLGHSYRKADPGRALEYYRRAVEIEPGNADYATGYSSALVQARRFAEAVLVLRKVILIVPENYPAHANLATALYALKQYSEALTEYQWLLKSKPDLTVAHYFIATAHDYLGEYPQALEAYEIFLARADQKINQLEIDKVKLRLPLLRRQIALGQGVKPKSRQTRKQ